MALVVLLAAAALPIAVSAVKLADVRSGVDDDRVVTVWASLTGAAYESDEARDRWVERARDALLRDPRVERVSRVGGLRRWRSGATVWSDTLWTDAEARWLPGRRSFRVAEHVVSDDYFAAVGLPLVAGRLLDGSERAGGEPAAVLSAEAARRLFPATSPLGRRYRRGAEGPWLRVVGVVGDQTGIWGDWTGTTAAPDPRVYVSERQATTSAVELHVRVRQATPELLRDVRRAVERVDLTQGVGRVRPLADEFAQSRVERRWIAAVLGGGALVTVLLSTMGVVGLVSYYTAARLPELALRVALGAPARRVAWLVARGTLRSVAIGIALGALALTVVEDGVRRFLYETSIGDPVVLALVALTTLVVAAAALVVPLRRLRRMSPQELLRR